MLPPDGMINYSFNNKMVSRLRNWSISGILLGIVNDMCVSHNKISVKAILVTSRVTEVVRRHGLAEMVGLGRKF